MKCIGMIAMLALGLLLGCSAGAGLPTTESTTGTPGAPTAPGTAGTPTPPETPAAPPVNPTTPSPPITGLEGCASDGAFDFHVFGAVQGHDGRLVAASAIENPEFGAASQVQRRPVAMAATIQGGSFSILCPTSLRENYAYPSYALFVDADGDGHCSAGDVGMAMQLYGWNEAVEHELGVTYEWARLRPVGELGTAIGGGASFCADYFPGL